MSKYYPDIFFKYYLISQNRIRKKKHFISYMSCSIKWV